MKIAEKYNKGKTVLSFEVFPPKKNEKSTESIYRTLEKLKEYNPDFVSVTYGAGGNIADRSTIEIASMIKNKYGMEAMAHLTCVNSTKDDITVIIEDLKKNNIDNILALRGDINPNFERKFEFTYASDMVSFLKKNSDFGIAGACYPEVHADAASAIDDIRNLKHKVDCGVDFLVSQLFFDNNAFFDFREKAEIAGINVPISAGIMPVTNASQIQRMVTMCGATLPNKFVKMLQKYDNKPESLIDAGIAYAVNQIIELISNGVDGIHIYTMNNPYIAKKILESIDNLL